MKNIHWMSGLGQGYAARFVYRPSAALYFDHTHHTDSDTSGATVYRKPKNIIKKLAEQK